jgi:hypothetical protein
MKYQSFNKTFYLKEFGNMKDKNYIQCDDEKQMLARFLADVTKLDPDVLACHDSSKIIDTLIQRLMKINDRN